MSTWFTLWFVRTEVIYLLQLLSFVYTVIRLISLIGAYLYINCPIIFSFSSDILYSLAYNGPWLVMNHSYQLLLLLTINYHCYKQLKESLYHGWWAQRNLFCLFLFIVLALFSLRFMESRGFRCRIIFCLCILSQRFWRCLISKTNIFLSYLLFVIH